jgi:hypothetical protein
MKRSAAATIAALLLAPASAEVTETALGPSALRPPMGRPVTSPDGRHLAWAASEGPGYAVFVDGEAWTPYDDVDDRTLCFSPDSRRVACRAQQDGKWMALVDGQAGALHQDVRCLTFSADSRHAAYVAGTGESWAVLVDGEVRATSAAEVVRLAISPDAALCAYVARRWQPQGRVEWAVISGEAGPEYAWVGDLAFVPYHGKLVAAYRAWQGGKWYAVVGGRASPPYDCVSPLIADPAGEHLAYVARSGDRSCVVLDETPGPDATSVPWQSLTLSAAGGRVAYVARMGKSCCAVIDGRPGPTYGWAENPVFSPDGRSVAYVAWRAEADASERCCAVIDGKEGPGYGRVEHLQFSADGRHLAYIASTGRESWVVLEGQQFPAGMGASNLCLSPDGRHVAYDYGVEGSADRVVAVDGEEQARWFHVTGMTFSPDGRHLVYLRVDKQFRQRVVIDHRESGPEYYCVETPPVFVDDTHAEALCIRGGTLYRVRIDVCDGN